MLCLQHCFASRTGLNAYQNPYDIERKASDTDFLARDSSENSEGKSFALATRISESVTAMRPV